MNQNGCVEHEWILNIGGTNITDIYLKEKRSNIMSKIRGKEIEHESDIVLLKYHTMIFVNGFLVWP